MTINTGDIIKRNTDPMKGPPDGVETDINCVVTQFSGEGGEREIQSQIVMPCHVGSAYSEGTIFFSLRDINLMLTVRLDELLEIHIAAVKLSLQHQGKVGRSVIDIDGKFVLINTSD